MKRTFRSFIILAISAVVSAAAVSCSHKEQPEPEIVMETSMGTIELKLYNQTPQHRDNFLKLVDAGTYDELLFHRVIPYFMIQGGDPNSKTAEPGQMLGDGDLGYQVPAEFRIEEGLFHKRGALAAAREGDYVNPEKASSACQFYIVWGDIYDDESLDRMQTRIDQMTNGKVKLTEQMRETYKTLGGTPHLDGSYTVFGEVTKGLEVVDAIQNVETDENDRPLENVKILSVRRK